MIEVQGACYGIWQLGVNPAGLIHLYVIDLNFASSSNITLLVLDALTELSVSVFTPRSMSRFALFCHLLAEPLKMYWINTHNQPITALPPPPPRVTEVLNKGN